MYLCFNYSAYGGVKTFGFFCGFFSWIWGPISVGPHFLDLVCAVFESNLVSFFSWDKTDWNITTIVSIFMGGVSYIGNIHYLFSFRFFIFYYSYHLFCVGKLRGLLWPVWNQMFRSGCHPQISAVFGTRSVLSFPAAKPLSFEVLLSVVVKRQAEEVGKRAPDKLRVQGNHKHKTRARLKKHAWK